MDHSSYNLVSFGVVDTRLDLKPWHGDLDNRSIQMNVLRLIPCQYSGRHSLFLAVS